MTRVKICGLSTPDTMLAALDAGADFIGLNFYPRSPRFVQLEQAVTLADLARGRANIVALVVDTDDDHLRTLARTLRPNFIQAHGKETPERIRRIKELTGVPVIKVIGVATAEDVSRQSLFEDADLMMFDAKAEALKAALPGGNGIAFDWTLLGERRKDFMLAGGLNPTNVAEAIRITGAPIVDVSSGVESAPGVKDPVLIKSFVRAAKAIQPKLAN